MLLSKISSTRRVYSGARAVTGARWRVDRGTREPLHVSGRPHWLWLYELHFPKTSADAAHYLFTAGDQEWPVIFPWVTIVYGAQYFFFSLAFPESHGPFPSAPHAVEGLKCRLVLVLHDIQASHHSVVHWTPLTSHCP